MSDVVGYFRCKHGALPDAGEHREDLLWYFGWHERFLVPFVNRTRVNMSHPLNETGSTNVRGESNQRRRICNGDADTAAMDPSPCVAWMFNATRRHCAHEAVKVFLSIPPSEERANLMRQFRDSCSVC